MKIEKQVCNLELSQKIKELGVKQESIFYHMENTALPSDNKIMYFRETKSYQIRKDKAIISSGVIKYISAFTVAELGEMLPNTIRKNEKDYFLNCYFSPLSSDGGTDFEVSYESGDDKTLAYISNEPNDMIESEANARAKMLIYLLENKLL